MTAPLPSPAVAHPPPSGSVQTRTVTYGRIGTDELKGDFAEPAHDAWGRSLEFLGRTLKP
ncbi:MAG: hypothetical protein QJR02_09635 [Sinobacteraceae bacterium]|nr:hypothetical protein [Nevskiaceae bacterium]